MTATTTLTPTAQGLADAFKAAAEAATEAATEATDDGGTCNLDSVFLRARRGRTAAAVKAAADAAGVTVTRTRGGYWNGWFVDVGERGQGAMRTRMVEAAYLALHAAGVKGTTIYYAMD